jgi:hypothetical protein
MVVDVPVVRGGRSDFAFLIAIDYRGCTILTLGYQTAVAVYTCSIRNFRVEEANVMDPRKSKKEAESDSKKNGGQ